MSGARLLARGQLPGDATQDDQQEGSSNAVKIRLGIDIACRASHQASCADDTGTLLWSGHRFRTDAGELEALWAKLPAAAAEVMVVMEPTRNAWVPLAAWFRRRGASVVLVPPEQAADLRAYYAKHTKTDRLDSRVLARLPVLHPDGLHLHQALGPGDLLKRAVKLRSSLVHRRTTCMQRLDALLELLGPGWVAAIGSDMPKTAFRFLATYADPHQVKRLGQARLGRWFARCSRGAWGEERAGEVLAAAEATLALWGDDGLDFVALAEDIAVEARTALGLTEEIQELEERIAVLYRAADPAQLVRSAPGVGKVLAAQIRGRLGDPDRFTSLAAARSFSGLVPRHHASGTTDHHGGPTKQGDACLREALFMAADHARKVDPTLAARYQRLMTDTARHHTAALCTIAAVLLTRILACLRSGQPYQLRDVDGRPITPSQGRAIVAQRYRIPPEIRAARRSLTSTQRPPRRDERAKQGVAKRSKATPAPTGA
jgi:transposase